MKPGRLVPVLLGVIIAGCATPQVEALRVLRRVDAGLSRERTATGFEHRLNQLGAKIEAGSKPEERVASFPAPADSGYPARATRPHPGYFPPRIVRVVYTVDSDGVVSLESADIVSLGSKFGIEQSLNKAPEPTSTSVTPPAGARGAPSPGVAHL